MPSIRFMRLNLSLRTEVNSFEKFINSLKVLN
jgi:hypothetical protein